CSVAQLHSGLSATNSMIQAKGKKIGSTFIANLIKKKKIGAIQDQTVYEVKGIINRQRDQCLLKLREYFSTMAEGSELYAERAASESRDQVRLEISARKDEQRQLGDELEAELNLAEKELSKLGRYFSG
ncbi:MAG: hypothetical protein AAF226_10815, partial [Verrucomicrobiota bacterium]